MAAVSVKRSIANIWRIEPDGISALAKFEAARIHFLRIFKWRFLSLVCWTITSTVKDNANGRKYGPYVYPNILKAFENKRYDRIWKAL